MGKVFNEASLEAAIMELFVNEGYEHIVGGEIHKEKEEILLLDDLKNYLSNNYAISENEILNIIADLKAFMKLPLYEANKKISKMISDGYILKRENIEDKDLLINFIDYDNIDNNIFKIINQLEIKGIENTRIPDGIVYVNGLPLVVLEFKTAVKESTTIEDAYKQLTIRYRRDIPDLFKFNTFVVISDGVNNKYGSLFAAYEYFYNWRKTDSESQETDGIDSLFTMIKGMFNKERFLDIVRDFIYFPDKTNNELKIVCRYPQYYATNKLLENIKIHKKPEGDGKGGTYFGATGCGKSYTMLFLARKLMKSLNMKSPTIILITDRTDLDDQLSKQFINAKQFIGDECIQKIDSRENLREVLTNRASGGVFLTTIQKFTEDTKLLSDRDNIICISDEAHRSQINLEQKQKITDEGIEKRYGFAKYLHDSLPNATYVGFTGTPLDATLDVFGSVVDKYTMSESVKDGITVNIVYEGRAAKVLLDQEKVKEIEEYYSKCYKEGSNEYQIEESKKAVTHLDVIIGDENRLEAVAEDFINHYEKRVFEKATVAGKAMFVCMDRMIAYRLYKKIISLRPEWAEEKICEDGVELTEKDKRELKEVAKINLVMTRDKNDPEELYELLGNKADKKELDRQFKNKKSNFKIAIVVDMWLTGFDVPCLDTMYIDKPIQEHTLIQTISRVNRVYPKKDKGLVVDYFGIKRNMNDALKKFNGQDAQVFEGIEESVKLVKNQLEILDKIFKDFNSNDFFYGSPLEKLKCLNNASEYVQITEELEKRFMKSVKILKSAYNLCSSSEEITEEERDKIYFYGAIRSIIFKLNKGEAPDITQMNEKVRGMIQEAIISDGVEEIFKSEKETQARNVDIFSNEYLEKINKIPLPNTKIKLLQRLLTVAIEEYKTVNKIKGQEFKERLQMLIDKYNERKYDRVYADEVLDNVAEELSKLFNDLEEDKKSFEKLGIDFEEKAFYDILKAVAQKFNFEYAEEKLIPLSKEVKKVVDDKAKYTDWAKKENIKAELKVGLILLLAEYDYPPVPKDEVFKEIFEQAENFKKYN